MLLSVVVLLPVGFKTRVVSAAGTLFCLAATIILVNVFPYGWTNSGGVNGSVWTISVYATGLVMLAASTGAALVAHYLEKAATPSDSTEPVESAESESESVSKADVDDDIEQALDGAELSWGGVEQQPKTKRLNLDMPETDSDLDRTAIENSEATTTRADSNDVDDAVDGSDSYRVANQRQNEAPVPKNRSTLSRSFEMSRPKMTMWKPVSKSNEALLPVFGRCYLNRLSAHHRHSAVVLSLRRVTQSNMFLRTSPSVSINKM